MTKHEAAVEHLRDHVRIVVEQLDDGVEVEDWPDAVDLDDLDMPRDACEAWCYIDGYACALDMTAKELIAEWDLWPKPAKTKRKSNNRRP